MGKKVFIAGDKPVASNFNLRDYTHIRAFHGCRPIDIASYQEQGIIPITRPTARQEALLRLGGGSIPDSKILAAFDRRWDKLNDVHKCVWFTLTCEELLNECGHYMISGSEFLLALGTELWYQHKLREVGTPSLLHCDAPIKMIPSGYIDSMEEAIIDGRYSPCGFKITGALAPEDIIKYEFPTRIPDPHDGYRVYRVQ